MNAPYRETDPNYVLTLCRFLADPKKVRVGVRREGKQWSVFVTTRSCPTRGYAGTDERVERAVLKALMLAQEGGMEGVDLSMSWSFPHPQGRIIDREGEHEDRKTAKYIAMLINGEMT